MAFKYKRIKLTWHHIYIILLYVLGFIGILLGIIKYANTFSKLHSLSYYFDQEKISTLTFSYLALLCIDIICIVLEFNTAIKLSKFKPTGYRLNNYLHGFVCLELFVSGLIISSVTNHDNDYALLFPIFAPLLWFFIIWVPILFYYLNRSELFSNENPNNNLQVTLVNMPSDILEACKNHSSSEEEYCNHIDDLLSSETITKTQAEALQTLYYPNDELIEAEEKTKLSSDSNSNSIIFCRKCGTKLLSESIFCNKCGISITEKKIKKEIIYDSCDYSIPKDSLFCPYCGNQLPKKRKFQKNRSFIISISILSVLLLILSTLNIIQFVKAQNDKETIEIYKNANNEKLDKISELNNEIKEWKEKAGDYSFIIYDLNFYKKHAAIIPDDGKKLYHTYDCDKLDHSKSFWIYNENIAYSLGNDPCPFCWDKET